MSPEFLLTTLIIVASPGTGAVYTIATGLARGARTSVWAAFACTLGIVRHTIPPVTGLAAIMHASAVAFSIIKLLGVAYLLYLAWKTFRDKSVFEVQAGPSNVSPWRVIVSGVLVNTLNPKLTIFFFAFLPQFVSPTEARPLPRMLELSTVFMLMTFAVFVGWLIWGEMPEIWTYVGAAIVIGSALYIAHREAQLARNRRRAAVAAATPSQTPAP